MCYMDASNARREHLVLGALMDTTFRIGPALLAALTLPTVVNAPTMVKYVTSVSTLIYLSIILA